MLTPSPKEELIKGHCTHNWSSQSDYILLWKQGIQILFFHELLYSIKSGSHLQKWMELLLVMTTQQQLPCNERGRTFIMLFQNANILLNETGWSHS